MLKLISHKRLCWTRSDTLWRFVNSRPFVAPVIFILWLLYYYYSLVTWIYQSIDHLCKPMITTIKVKKTKFIRRSVGALQGPRCVVILMLLYSTYLPHVHLYGGGSALLGHWTKSDFIERGSWLIYAYLFIFLDHCQTSGIDLNIIIIAYNIAAMGPRKKTSSSGAQHSMSIGNAKLVCVC